MIVYECSKCFALVAAVWPGRMGQRQLCRACRLPADDGGSAKNRPTITVHRANGSVEELGLGGVRFNVLTGENQVELEPIRKFRDE